MQTFVILSGFESCILIAALRREKVLSFATRKYICMSVLLYPELMHTFISMCAFFQHVKESNKINFINVCVCVCTFVCTTCMYICT